MQPDEIRLFVALLPTEPVRHALAKLMHDVNRVRWANTEQLHLTLRFIGNVPLDARQKIENALERVRVKPFFLETAGVGGFPPRGHPHVLWAGIGRPHPLLHQLRQQVDDSLLTTGVPFELRAFSPHFTLGRSREAPPVAVQHWLKRYREFAGPTWPVNAFHLMASELTSDGAVYRSVRTFELS